MRRVCICILVLLSLAGLAFGASTDSVYSSISVSLVAQQGIAGGFSKVLVGDVNTVSTTNTLTGGQVNMTYDDANQRFESDGVYYYLQVFIPDHIEFSVSCSPFMSGTTEVIGIADMSMNVGTDTATADTSSNTLVWTRNENTTRPSEFVENTTTDSDGNTTGAGTYYRAYPTVYSSSVDVVVDVENVTTSTRLEATLTLSVKVV